MGEDNGVLLTATLDEAGSVATGQLGPDIREDIKRGDVRLTLQSAAVHMSAPGAAITAPPPVTLYSRPETTQQNRSPDLRTDDDFTDTHAAKSLGDGEDQALRDYFRRWGQDSETVDLRIDPETLTFTLSFSAPVPEENTRNLHLVLSDGAQQIVNVQLLPNNADSQKAENAEGEDATHDGTSETDTASDETITVAMRMRFKVRFWLRR